MKRFCIHIFTLLASSLGLLYVIQTIIDNNGHNSNQWPYKTFNIALRDGTNADIVIFGDSRAGCHFNTVKMDSILNMSCCNLGLAGYSFDYQFHFVVKPYLRHNSRPKLIVLELSPQDFFDKRNPKFDYSFLPYIWKDEFQYYFDVCNEVSPIYKYLPFKYYGLGIGTLKTLMKPDRTNALYKDCFDPLYSEYSNNFNLLPGWEIENDKSVNSLKNFVMYCDRESIPLILVCSPMHKTDFYDKCDMSNYRNLVQTAAPNVPFLDYSLMFDSDTDYFSDPTHLNCNGSDIFTTIITDDIRKIVDF